MTFGDPPGAWRSPHRWKGRSVVAKSPVTEDDVVGSP